MQYYHVIYDEKKRKSVQTSLDRKWFLRPMPPTSRASPPTLLAASFSSDEEEEIIVETIAEENLPEETLGEDVNSPSSFLLFSSITSSLLYQFQK